MIDRFASENRGVSPVIGVVLLVAVTVMLSAIVAVYGLGVTDKITGQPSTTAATVSISETNAGSEITVDRVEKPVEIQLNGQKLYEVDQSDVGASYFVPTAPGDRITVVATGESQQLILNEQVDERNAGDFVAYYDFSAQEGDTLVDHSGNGNDGALNNDPQWVEGENGPAIQFDGSDDFVRVDNLNVDEVEEVSEFTVVAEYRVDDVSGEPAQIVEHRYDAENFEWFLETDSSSATDDYQMRYHVNHPSGTELTTTERDYGETVTVVATYDGETMTLYEDGEQVAQQTVDEPGDVYMGNLVIGADGSAANSQYLDGRIYELRLYYTAMDDQEANAVTSAVNGTAA